MENPWRPPAAAGITVAERNEKRRRRGKRSTTTIRSKAKESGRNGLPWERQSPDWLLSREPLGRAAFPAFSDLATVAGLSL
jgi:hypothetical protein